jgi:hypothetical protein
MQVRFTLISVIFACLLVFLGFILDNKAEARSLKQNLRDAAVRQLRRQHLAIRKTRQLDEFDDEKQMERSENGNTEDSQSDEDDQEKKTIAESQSNSDESDRSEREENDEDEEQNFLNAKRRLFGGAKFAQGFPNNEGDTKRADGNWKHFQQRKYNFDDKKK